MATQNYFLNKKAPGENLGNPTKATAPTGSPRGNPTGHPSANKTPAPVFDETARDKTFGRENYGSNAYGGPSSLEPGQCQKMSGIDAQNPDPILDLVQKQGLARDDKPADRQLRDIGSKNVGPAHGHSRRGVSDGSPGSTVPDKLGTSVAPNPRTDQYGGTK